jgi:hypothetical protein
MKKIHALMSVKNKNLNNEISWENILIIEKQYYDEQECLRFKDERRDEK